MGTVIEADLPARVALLERQLEQLRSEMDTRIIAAANRLREDDSFMKPAAQKFTDHAGNHLFDKAARRLLWLVLGLFGTAAAAFAAWLGSRGIR